MFHPRVSVLTAVLLTVLVLGVVIISGLHGFLLQSFLSFGLLSILSLTALPLCRVLFGRGVAPFLFCYSVGYIIHGFLLSLCGWAFGIRPLVFATYFATTLIVCVLWSRRSGQEFSNPIPHLESWDRSDVLLIALWLLVTFAAVAPAFLNVGAQTPQGYAYRAYFNGDAFRNIATAGTLMRSGIPPENPYFAGYTLHYYWFFHILPAYWMTLFPSFRPDFLLVQFSLTTALAFVAALFATVRYLSKSRRTVLFILPLFLAGGSYEGLYILKHLHEKNLPWTAFTTLNVDGILRWTLSVPQVDTLFRPLLYAPQHLLAISTILIALVLRTSKNGALPRIGSLLLLFLSVGFSVIVAAVGVLGVCLIFLGELLQGKWKQIWPELIAGLLSGPLLLILYIMVFHMVNPSGEALIFGLDWNLIQNLPLFSLQWGALLIFGLLGLLFAKPKDLRFATLATYLILSATLVLFLRINVLGLTEVGLKAGYIVNVALLLLATLFADRIFGSTIRVQKWFVVVAALLIFPASITLMMDAYNCQDIKNVKFTTFITAEKMEMMQWIRNNLEPEATVQDYRIRAPGFLGSHISEIPPFANRPMYLGDTILSEIFQIPPEDLRRRREIAAQLLELNNPKQIFNIAQKEGISYFLVWDKDGAAFQQDEARLYFKRISVFREISVFRVTAEKPYPFAHKGKF